MINVQFIKPIISMLATLTMCIILSACQSTKASTEYVDDSPSGFFTDEHQIRIKHESGQRSYEVDDKRFSFDQLSDEQKERITKLEEKFDKLEGFAELDGERMEAWGEKMEAVGEQMELQAEKFEAIVGDFEFEENARGLEEYSRKIAKASQNLEAKMQILEKKMKSIQLEMPKVDHQMMDQLESDAEKMGQLLIQIAKEI